VPQPPRDTVKLHYDAPGGYNVITACEPGRVTVNRAGHTRALVVLRDRLITDWPPQSFDELGEAHFALLTGLGATIVLLGTGRTLRFPKPALTRALSEARIGLEVMDTGAACRTYNILAGEGRQVAAALLPG
jgi:uncharacterized protein